MSDEIKVPVGCAVELLDEPMTLRDKFAAAALTGFLASPTGAKLNGNVMNLEEACYLAADAMLNYRKFHPLMP